MKSRGYFDKLQFPSVFNIRTSAASLFTVNWSSRLHSWCRTCPIQRPIFLSSLLTLSGEELGLQNLCFTIFVRYIIKSIQYLTLKHLCYNLVWCQMAISGKVEHRVKFAFEEQSLCFFISRLVWAKTSLCTSLPIIRRSCCIKSSGSKSRNTSIIFTTSFYRQILQNASTPCS